MSLTAKLILWPLVIATIVASALWIAGGKKQEYSAALQIDASPEVVFAYLTEPEKHKSWISGLAQVDQLESNTDENGDSRRITTDRVVTVDGHDSRFEDEVIRFEPNELLTVRSTNQDHAVTWIYQLEPKNEQTFFTYRVIKQNRGLQRCLAPLSRDHTQTKVDQDIRKLKQLVESSH